MATSNTLKFSVSKPVNGMVITVKIRLDDERKNGHQDFAITGDIYQAGKPKTDRYYIAGGCIHDEIEKYFPEFKIFIRLHLCDWEGIPMYAVENGFYHLTNGFNSEKVEDSGFKEKFCDYYRVTPEQFTILQTSRNKLQYALHLQNLGILKQWKEEANKAIEYLEQLTGVKFLPDSTKTQFNAPTDLEIKEEQKKVAGGYYTPEAEEGREKERINKLVKKLEDERDKEIQKHVLEFEVKKQVLLQAGSAALENCIFYNHSKELAFNWRGYNNLPESKVNEIMQTLSLPEGVTIKNSKQ